MRRTLLPKRVALPVYASDGLSSVTYAPDEIMLTLALAGVGALAFSPWVGVAVGAVVALVIACYRQVVRAYPSGGGDYEVATANLGRRSGLTVASALLVDYVLTVAVAVSAGAQYAVALLPGLRGREVLVAVAVVLALMVANLRGTREAGRVLALPAYLFMAAVGLTAVVGFVRAATGTLPAAESADLGIVPDALFDQGLVGLAGAVLVLRAFASGCVALTGVETVANGVPALRRPKSRNAATVLAVLGALSATFLTSILVLAHMVGVRYVERPAQQLLRDGVPVGESYVQVPVLGQVARSVFAGAPVLFVLVTAAAGLILLMAANTAFNGFPVLGSILARDGYLPRQLYTRGDRLVFSNGIIGLAVGAVVLVVAFEARVTSLVHLYIVGVFLSFTLGQLGMVRHWDRALRTEPDAAHRRRMRRSRWVAVAGAATTGTVLVVVLVAKMTRGAWIAVLAMAVVGLVMSAIRRHYDDVAAELALEADVSQERALPSRVHAVVLVSRLHKPTMRALAYARATRPSVLEGLTVSVDRAEAERLRERWEELDLPVPLRILDSPYRDVTRPVVDYVRSIRRRGPRDVVVVYVPEYVVGRWWEHLLHNQSVLRLRSRLLLTPGVVVASVPWQLRSAGPGEEGEHDGRA